MVTVTQNGNSIQSSVVELVADTLQDLDEAPVDYYGVGSNCIVLEDSSVWVLGNDRFWHQI